MMMTSRQFQDLDSCFSAFPLPEDRPAGSWLPAPGSAGRLAGAGSSWNDTGNVLDRDKHKGGGNSKGEGKN